MLHCDWLLFSISILPVWVCCSLSGPLSYGSPVVVYLDRGHYASDIFYFTIPVDAVRVKSYVNRLFDPACVAIRITVNKLYFFPKRIVSDVVNVF